MFDDMSSPIRRVVPQPVSPLVRSQSLRSTKHEAGFTRMSWTATRKLLISDSGRKLPKNAAYHLDLMKQGILFAQSELYLPYLYAQPVTPMAYLSPETLVVPIEPRSLFDDASRYNEEIESAAKAVDIDLAGLFIKPEELDFGNQQRLTLLSLVSSGATLDASIEVKHAQIAGSDERLVASARSLTLAGFKTLLAEPDRRVRGRSSCP